MTVNFDLFKVSSKTTSLKIYKYLGMEKLETFGQQIDIIQRVPLGTQLQKVVTDLFISTYRGATVI